MNKHLNRLSEDAVWYVGVKHENGVVITGPTTLSHALTQAMLSEKNGIPAEVPADTPELAAWFVIMYKLFYYKSDVGGNE